MSPWQLHVEEETENLEIIKVLCFNYLLIFERETGKQSVSEEGTEREGYTESEVGSRLQACSTEHDMGLQLTNR